MSDPVTILVRHNGPLRIEADQAHRVRLIDHEGNEIVPTPGKPISLCRCGHSAKKPLCDGTHRHVGFCVDGEPAAAAPATPVVPSASGTPTA